MFITVNKYDKNIESKLTRDSLPFFVKQVNSYLYKLTTEDADKYEFLIKDQNSEMPSYRWTFGFYQKLI
jgi:hypothetical protein